MRYDAEDKYVDIIHLLQLVFQKNVKTVPKKRQKM